MEEVIVLTSGANSRFWPLGQDRHKTLYPVGLGTTIFGATLVDLSRAGYKRIIVTARIGDVERMRKEVPETMDVFFIIQNEAKGQGDAILRAARCLREETFYLTTADKIYAGILVYPDLDEKLCRKFWIEKTGLRESNFIKSTVIQGRHKTRRVRYGICNAGLSSAYFKQKMLIWIDLLSKQLISKGYYSRP